MKSIKITLLSLALSVTACNDNFLNVTPPDRYSDDVVWTDEALINLFVNDIYIGQHYGFKSVMMSSVCDEAMEVWGWETAPIVQSSISPTYIGIFAPGGSVWNSELSWNHFYSKVRDCNLFLQNIEANEMTGDNITQLKGEVYFLRAYYYALLMSFHGGVPLIDRPYELDEDYQLPRNTLAETVDFIIKDLDTAIDILPLSGDKARATKGAAMALKARVLLYAASDLFNSKASYDPGYSHPELVSYTDDNRRERWQKAKDAAKAVIDLNQYKLIGEGGFSTSEEASENYANIFLNTGTEEDIFLHFFDNINYGFTDYNNRPNLGQLNEPNGWWGWGGNTPIGQMVDSYEMINGEKFDWNNPEHKAAPYKNRDPRFYASILYDGAPWRQRPSDTYAIDPEGIVQTGFYENADGTTTPGLDTRQGPIYDWNGTYSGYYMRKFIDPAIDHEHVNQKLPFRQIRYAEVILNYVEACLELGEEDEAVKYLNKIRVRAGMPTIPAGETGTVLRDRYRNERKIELAFEQHRYFDIRRWMIAPQAIHNAKGVNIRYPYGSDTPNYEIIDIQERLWDNKCYFLPILRDEMNRNQLLIQNPGYE